MRNVTKTEYLTPEFKNEEAMVKANPNILNAIVLSESRWQEIMSPKS